MGSYTFFLFSFFKFDNFFEYVDLTNLVTFIPVTFIYSPALSARKPQKNILILKIACIKYSSISFSKCGTKL